MYQHFDPIEWETVYEYRPCTACDGGRLRCMGACNGMLGGGLRRRPQAEIDRLKAERTKKEEDNVLARADEIRARRGIGA
jgi:hypothetical protein